ncbi:MAG: 2-amino-4-hydroxy-6-hydroxymethyldihydropteridine diphosphokinase [Puia sp.]|nr:2-amino-4-hydroxy-6-hydroxymethyldihydropteridine diphosphokinase [Puia sp.]
MTNKAYLLIGGNEGERADELARACRNIISYCGPLVLHSSLYETAAWGKTDQPAFLNQALLLETALPAPALMETLLGIEEMMGRKRLEKYGPRIIDIDMIFFNRDSIRLPGLIIPHPEMQNRRFVLEPMNEIASSYVHPILQKTIAELLLECTDRLDVKKIPSII